MTHIGAHPTSIRIFLADGIPDGLRIVEKSNWTGRAVVAGRADLARSSARPELQQPGVYILTGLSLEGSPTLYIGETDVLKERLAGHAGTRDFWTRFVAFTSTNEGLNKANLRYLEARLIGLAKSANQWNLDNATIPAIPPMSEADRADAEWFLREMLLIFPLLGIDAFESAATQVRDEAPGRPASPVLHLRTKYAEATGREVGDGFVVMAGTRARVSETRSIPEGARRERRGLQQRGVLVREGDSLVFTQDYRFSSPSAAASVLTVSSVSGPETWKDDQGRTLRDVQVGQPEGGMKSE